jgi:hypothetical protein
MDLVTLTRILLTSKQDSSNNNNNNNEDDDDDDNRGTFSDRGTFSGLDLVTLFRNDTTTDSPTVNINRNALMRLKPIDVSVDDSGSSSGGGGGGALDLGSLFRYESGTPTTGTPIVASAGTSTGSRLLHLTPIDITVDSPPTDIEADIDNDDDRGNDGDRDHDDDDDTKEVSYDSFWNSAYGNAYN